MTTTRRADVAAGLTAAAVVVPKAMAYSTIAGLPVQIGLYTAIVPMLVYALLGSSRTLSVSTTTTIAILTGAELARVSPAGDAATLVGATATLTLMVGIILTLSSVARLGFVANFISEPVLAGFKCGIGFVIVIDQLPKLLGVHIDKAGFFRDIAAIAGQLPHISLPTVVVGIVTILLLVGCERLVPRAPAPLVAIGLAITASALWNLPTLGVAVIGAIPTGLPMPVAPHVELVNELWAPAAGIALMSFTETIAAARAFAPPGAPRVVPNRELLATGVANAAGGIFGTMPAGGGTSQTAVNGRAGARSQAAAVVTALAALATLVIVGPIIGRLPQASLAAVVIVYSADLIKFGEFQAIRRVRPIEFSWALVAVEGVMVLGTLQGILVAVIVSLLALAQQVYDPPVFIVGRKRGTQVFRQRSDEHPDDEFWPGLLILRIVGRASFLNAQRIGDKVGPLVDHAQPAVVLLDCSALIDIEYTALKMLVEAEDTLRRRGIALWLAALNPAVLAVAQRSPLGDTLGRERMFFNVQTAVDQFRRRQSAA